MLHAATQLHGGLILLLDGLSVHKYIHIHDVQDGAGHAEGAGSSLPVYLNRTLKAHKLLTHSNMRIRTVAHAHTYTCVTTWLSVTAMISTAYSKLCMSMCALQGGAGQAEGAARQDLCLPRQHPKFHYLQTHNHARRHAPVRASGRVRPSRTSL